MIGITPDQAGGGESLAEINDSGSRQDSMVDDSEGCPVCAQGHITKREENLAFLQWTDKGLVRCAATITVAVCDRCGFKTWDEDAERRLDDAVRREYAERR